MRVINFGWPGWGWRFASGFSLPRSTGRSRGNGATEGAGYLGAHPERSPAEPPRESESSKSIRQISHLQQRHYGQWQSGWQFFIFPHITFTEVHSVVCLPRKARLLKPGQYGSISLIARKYISCDIEVFMRSFTFVNFPLFTDTLAYLEMVDTWSTRHWFKLSQIFSHGVSFFANDKMLIARDGDEYAFRCETNVSWKFKQRSIEI